MQQAIINYIIIGLTLSTIGLIYKYSDNQTSINKNEINEEKDDFLRDKLMSTENLPKEGITKNIADTDDEPLSKLEKCKLDEPKANRKVRNKEESEEEKSTTIKKKSVKTTTTTTTPKTTAKKTTKKANINKSTYKEGVTGNYERKRKSKSGPGEGGIPVVLTGREEQIAQQSINRYGFNIVASEKISYDRTIKDTRQKECKYWSYPEDLPKVSVVIVFIDEPFSTLVRTIHSVINTSPPRLLEDIILVDDFSIDDDLKVNGRLEKYIKKFDGLVRLYRNKKHEGLIRSRMNGVKQSKSEVVVILDAHVECVDNWLPPLLSVIKANRKTLAVPMVDGLDWNTYEHTMIHRGEKPFIGIFEWGFLYKEMSITTDLLKGITYKTEPYPSPTHAGGLLAFDRKWFLELGGYDDGLKIWGAEQYELSFKTWLCGGSLKWVPCSRIAHVYRGPRKYYTRPFDMNQVSINHMRVAEAWMDEYKEYYYIRTPEIVKLNFGNISKQLEIKERLQCKPFKWFMESVAPGLLEEFPLPPKNKVWGECRNANFKVCLTDTARDFGQPISVTTCHGSLANQHFRLNVKGELSSGEHCYASHGNVVKKYRCYSFKNKRWKPVGEWEYDQEKKTLYSKKQKKCLEATRNKLLLASCDNNNKGQKWDWKKVYIEIEKKNSKSKVKKNVKS